MPKSLRPFSGYPGTATLAIWLFVVVSLTQPSSYQGGDVHVPTRPSINEGTNQLIAINFTTDRGTNMAPVLPVQGLVRAFLTSEFFVNQAYYALILVPAALVIWYTRRKYGHDPESAPLFLRVFALDHRPICVNRSRSLNVYQPPTNPQHTYRDPRPSARELDALLGEDPSVPPTSKAEEKALNGHALNGHVIALPRDTNQDGVPGPEKLKNIPLLVFCFFGLQAVFLTWGIVQEKMVTKPYASRDKPEKYDRFTDSQFLVFSNKVSGFALAALYLAARKLYRSATYRHVDLGPSAGWVTTPTGTQGVGSAAQAPALYRYAFASLSNILSSWCQYEALKFVSFPTQVLFKSGKIIPSMIMSRILSAFSSGTVPSKRYSVHDYVSAALVSLGISAFLLSRRWESSGVRENFWSLGTESGSYSVANMSGIILLTGYVIFDSFTSNWQSQIFERFNGPKTAPGSTPGPGSTPEKNVTSWDMMCHVNLFSSLFTGLSLALKAPAGGGHGLTRCLDFALEHPAFVTDLTALSLCSALGQIFIFVTISTFGPVAFVTMMTIRQGFAVLLSCLIYGHRVGGLGYLGIGVVFVALFGKIYLSSATRRHRSPDPTFRTADERDRSNPLRTLIRALRYARLSLTTRNKLSKRYCLF